MRAIIIDDKDARALLTSLELAAVETSLGSYGVEENEAWNGIPLSTRQEILRRLHGRFHYVVCRWLQDQGANVVR